MMGEEQVITPVEMDVLQCLQEIQPATVRDVAEAIAAKRNLARTTVLTHLERLRKRKFLVRRSVNGVNHYSLARPAEEIRRSAVADFVERMFGGSFSPLVAYLSQQTELSEADTRELQRLIERIGREEKP